MAYLVSVEIIGGGNGNVANAYDNRLPIRSGFHTRAPQRRFGSWGRGSRFVGWLRLFIHKEVERNGRPALLGGTRIGYIDFD